MLTTGGLFTPDGVKAAGDEALHGHYRRAAEFLRQIFAPTVSGLSEAQLQAVLELAHRRANAVGAQSSRLQLQYLVPVASWGCYFDTDPQYWGVLHHSGWPEQLPAGPQQMNSALIGLAHAIDAFEAEVAADRADVARILWAFEEVSGHDWSQSDTVVLRQAVRHVWPARARRLGGELTSYCCTAMLGHLKEFDLSRPEIALLTCMSFQLGHGLCLDPLWPWIAEILQLPSSDQRRKALTEGLRDSYRQRIVAIEAEDE